MRLFKLSRSARRVLASQALECLQCGDFSIRHFVFHGRKEVFLGVLPATLNRLSEFTEEGGGLKYLTANFFIFGYSLACCFHQIKGLIVWAIEVLSDIS